MAYLFYLDGVLLPVTPSKLQMKINNQNSTMNLIDDGQINILKKAGLTDITFDALLPNVSYPFSVYDDGFQKASYFISLLEGLKTGEKPFQFIVTRETPSGGDLFHTNIKVSLEDYTLKEDKGYGLDVTASIKLKQYKAYATKTLSLASASGAVSVEQTRETTTSPAPTTTKTYTVKAGDSLWAISKVMYGNGANYIHLYRANSSIISNPNLIYPGQVLTLPVL